MDRTTQIVARKIRERRPTGYTTAMSMFQAAIARNITDAMSPSEVNIRIQTAESRYPMEVLQIEKGGVEPNPILSGSLAECPESLCDVGPLLT